MSKETKINLNFGNIVIPGILNDSTAAKELLKRLPYTISAHRYEFDVCGVMSNPLPWVEEELVTGWHNGDISFTKDGDYFTILFGHEEESGNYGRYANLGKVTCELSQMYGLDGGYDIYIELAE